MSPFSDEPLVFEGVDFAYGRRSVLQGLDLRLRPGQVTLMVAPNGRGKTTALWLAAGLLRPDRGQVRAFGRDPFRDRAVLGEVGFVAEGSPLPETWTGQEVLAFQAASFPRWSDELARELGDLMKLRLDTKVRDLSRGERGRLALAAVLGAQPRLLLLDEPTLGLDVATRRLVTKMVLTRLAADGATVLMATHDIVDAERVGDRMVFLQDGRIGIDEAIPELVERHRVLRWDGAWTPPPGWEALDLPSAFGRRAVVPRWRPQYEAECRARGVDMSTADLETIYLVLTGEVEHAW